MPLSQSHLYDQAAGHQRQYQQSGAGPFRLRQFHHRGEEGRHHHQCADRPVAGAGRADAGQCRQLHQFSQLSAGGFSTRFQKTENGGTATSDTNATYGLQITPGGDENVSLSAASTPALYLAGNSGAATEIDTTTGTGTNAQVTHHARRPDRPPDQDCRSDSSTPTAIFSVNQEATTGTTTAQATVVDSSGNVYVIGNATGNFGNQLNQGTPGRLSHQI